VSRSVPVAWLQLTSEKPRFLAAVAGIAFAVILMLTQLGFQDALLSTSGMQFSNMRCDLALISPQYQSLLGTGSFPERRLYQALAFEGVQSVTAVYIAMVPWRNPIDQHERNILLMGFRPKGEVFDLSGIDEHVQLLRQENTALFDERGRPEFGPVAEIFRRDRRLPTEILGRRLEVVGLFRLGTSFAADGNVLVSDETFLRILPHREPGVVDLGLIRLRSGVSPALVLGQMSAALPADVKILAHQQLVDLEQTYWSENTPVGFVFGLGLLMSIVVGAIIVYQILYTDVSDHLQEYATLKAMGYRNTYLSFVVIQEALILAVLGFMPGLAISQGVYVISARATLLPLAMTLPRVAMVYALTVSMCIFSGLMAIRKLRSADPAEVF